MSWGELLDRGRSDSFLYEGIIAQDAADVHDQVLVTVLAHDKEQTWGPMPWMPRVASDGSVVIPREGDRCVIGAAATDEPGTPALWIIAWEAN